MAKDLFWEKVRQNLVEAGVLVENTVEFKTAKCCFAIKRRGRESPSPLGSY